MVSPELCRSNMPLIKKQGFTFIDLLIAISLMSITFFPLMTLYSFALEQVAMTNDSLTAVNLAREGMEMVKNLNLPAERLEKYGVIWYPEKKDPPLEINKALWRIKTTYHKGSRPLRVDVEVLKDSSEDTFMKVSTLFEDLF